VLWWQGATGARFQRVADVLKESKPMLNQSALTGVLTPIVNGNKQKDIDQLLPWNFKG
jgi:hypothetical protein